MRRKARGQILRAGLQGNNPLRQPSHNSPFAAQAGAEVRPLPPAREGLGAAKVSVRQVGCVLEGAGHSAWPLCPWTWGEGASTPLTSAVSWGDSFLSSGWRSNSELMQFLSAVSIATFTWIS